MRFFSLGMVLLLSLLLVGCGKSDKDRYLESLQEIDERRKADDKKLAEYRAKRDAMKAQYLEGKVGAAPPQSAAFKSLKPIQQNLLREKMASILINPLFDVTILKDNVAALDPQLLQAIQKDLEASAEKSSSKDYLSLRRSIDNDRKPIDFDSSLSYEERVKQDKLAEQKFIDTYAPHVQILEKMELTSPEKVQLWYLTHVKSDKDFQTLITALQKLFAKQGLTDAEKKLLQETSLTSRTYDKLSKGGN